MVEQSTEVGGSCDHAKLFENGLGLQSLLLSPNSPCTTELGGLSIRHGYGSNGCDLLREVVLAGRVACCELGSLMAW